jgi:hypothetical protein
MHPVQIACLWQGHEVATIMAVIAESNGAIHSGSFSDPMM